MTDHIDRELQQSINEVVHIYNRISEALPHEPPWSTSLAAILTLATVTHHQNGMKP